MSNSLNTFLLFRIFWIHTTLIYYFKTWLRRIRNLSAYDTSAIRLSYRHLSQKTRIIHCLRNNEYNAITTQKSSNIVYMTLNYKTHKFKMIVNTNKSSTCQNKNIFLYVNIDQCMITLQIVQFYIILFGFEIMNPMASITR